MADHDLFNPEPLAHEHAPPAGPFPRPPKGSALAELALGDDPDPKVTAAVTALPKPTDGVDFSDAVIGRKAAEVGEAKTGPFSENPWTTPTSSKGDVAGHDFHGNQWSAGSGSGGAAATTSEHMAAAAHHLEKEIQFRSAAARFRGVDHEMARVAGRAADAHKQQWEAHVAQLPPREQAAARDARGRAMERLFVATHKHPVFGWGVKSPDGAFFTDEEGIVHPIRNAGGYDPAAAGEKPSKEPAKDSEATSRYKADLARFKSDSRYDKLAKLLKERYTPIRARSIAKIYGELRAAGHSHEQVVRALSAQVQASARSVDATLVGRAAAGGNQVDRLEPEQHAQIDADRAEGAAAVAAAKTEGPVSEAFHLTGSAAFQSTMSGTLAVIDSVHSDGKLPEISMRPQTAAESRSAYGTYFPRGTRSEISVNGSAEHPELTAAHEIGHFLDNQGLPSEEHPGSPRLGSGQWASYEPTGAMREVMTSIGKTEAVQTIREHVPGTLPGYSSAQDARLRNYYLQPHEQFARAYAQYVATKSGNPKMQAQVEGIRASAYKVSANSQWSHADFAPVAQAMDKLMQERGWAPK